MDSTEISHLGYVFGVQSSLYHPQSIPAALKTVVITQGTAFWYSAFSNCQTLRAIVIPSSIIDIRDSAFTGCAKLKTVYYAGTAEEWSGVHVSDAYNVPLQKATVYFYSQEQPVGEGLFWHYVDGVPTPW